MSAMEDSPPQPPQNGDQNSEEEDPSTSCPYFSASKPFQFMTIQEFQRIEDLQSVQESEYSFAYVRPMNGVVGLLENPHGSVKLSQGGTTVVVGVYGPSDVRMSKELPHRAAVDVLFRPKVTGSGGTSGLIAAGMMDPIINERAFEQTITGILESVIHLEDHVQAGFNVIIHEVEDKGCLLSTCINASALALLNAGCSLRCTFCSITVITCGEAIVIDPSSEQIEEFKKRSQESTSPFATLTFTFTNATDKKVPSPQVIGCSCTGVISPETLTTVYELLTCTDVVTEIFNFFWRVISNDVVGVCGSLSGGIKHEDKMDDKEIDKGSSVTEEEEGEVVDD